MSEIPVTIATTFSFAVPVYWLTGLRPDGSAFGFFLLTFFLYGQLSLSWAHLIAMLMPNGEMAQTLSGLFMAVFSLFAGYVHSFKIDLVTYYIILFHLFNCLLIVMKVHDT